MSYQHSTDDLRNRREEKSVSSPIGTERASNEFLPIPLSQLGDSEKLDWIWHGWVAHGFSTLLIGLWKAGKSTLVGHLLKAMENGGEIAGEIKPCKAVVIAEEGSGLWARRRDELEIADHVHVVVKPFKGRPTVIAWREFVNSVAESVIRGEYDLVIIDTWQAVNPSDNENDSARMMEALSPLHAITEAGAGLLIVHHPKKGDASEGQASRGSGAMPGFVDTIIELRRFNAEQAGDTRRKLKGISRFDETPSEIVIELLEDGYKTVGTSGEVNRYDRLEFILNLLKEKSFTPDEILESWPTDKVKPGIRAIRNDLHYGYEQGKWSRTGEGKRGSPFIYEFVSCTLPPLRQETNISGDCDHTNSENWIHRDGTAFCPGCDKFMGRVES